MSNRSKCPASFNHKHPSASVYQEKYFDLLKNDNNRDKFKIYYDPDEFIYNIGKYRNKKKEDLKVIIEKFYLKPVYICAPDELVPGNVLICNTCGKNLSTHGWGESRYIHGLKNGMYLLQRRYNCKVCKVTITGYQALNELKCISDDIRLLFPLWDRYNSMVHRDLLDYILDDALAQALALALALVMSQSNQGTKTLPIF